MVIKLVAFNEKDIYCLMALLDVIFILQLSQMQLFQNNFLILNYSKSLLFQATVSFMKKFTTRGNVFKGKLVTSGHQNFKNQLIIYPGIAHKLLRPVCNNFDKIWGNFVLKIRIFELNQTIIQTMRVSCSYVFASQSSN